MNLLEAFKQLDIINELLEKKNNKEKSNINKNQVDTWKSQFYTEADLGFPQMTGNVKPYFSRDFAQSFIEFRERFTKVEIDAIIKKLKDAISSFSKTGKPEGVSSEKINGIDHTMFELKLGNTTITKKPVRCLYFITRDSQNQNCVIIANILIHTNSNLSAKERNSGKNAYVSVNSTKK